MTAPAQELITGVTIHKSGGYQVAFKGRALMYFKADMLPLAIRMRREAEEWVAANGDLDLDVMVGALRMKYSELKMQAAYGDAAPAEVHGQSPGSNGAHHFTPEEQTEPPEPQEAEAPSPAATYLDLLRAALDADTAYAETLQALDLAQERHDAAKQVAMEAWDAFFREIGFWKSDPRQSALSLTKPQRSPRGA